MVTSPEGFFVFQPRGLTASYTTAIGSCSGGGCLYWNATKNAFESEHSYRSQTESDHVAAVNLARRLGIPEILPAAFYAAGTSLSVRDIINGKTDPFLRANCTPDDNAKWEMPEVYAFDDPKDAMTCAEGQARLNAMFNLLLYLARALMVKGDRQCINKREDGCEYALGTPLPCSQVMDKDMPKPPNYVTNNAEVYRICSLGKGPNIWELNTFCSGVVTCPPCRVVLTEACRSYRG